MVGGGFLLVGISARENLIGTIGRNFPYRNFITGKFNKHGRGQIFPVDISSMRNLISMVGWMIFNLMEFRQGGNLISMVRDKFSP